jgi:beta-galactosidase GanA
MAKSRIIDGQLYIDDEPYLILGGELGNSSASFAPELGPQYRKLREMNLNTVLVPVYWDLFEPQEGQYEFALIRESIDEARKHDLKLVLLWFGTWKNSMSCYVPSWIKRQPNKYLRVTTRAGEPQEILSPFCSNSLNADKQAFCALMRWLKDYDESIGTVIMVQVENEIGMIPEPRDYSSVAEKAFHSLVPKELIDLCKNEEADPYVEQLWKQQGEQSTGNWAQIFGSSPQAEELFSAWSFAVYTESVTKAGKQEYDLPMFANAALIRDGYKPGQYPAGGPLPHISKLWSLFAPTLDFLAPDIYFPNFTYWIEQYAKTQKTVFVPEVAPTERVAANALFAISATNSIGTCPFAVETISPAQGTELQDLYGHLSNADNLILEAQRLGKIFGATPRLSFDWHLASEVETLTIGQTEFHVKFDKGNDLGTDRESELPTHGTGRWNAPKQTPLGGVMVIQLREDEYVALGKGVVITFSSEVGKVGIDWCQEGHFENEVWIPGRWLNGDQTHQGRHVHLSNHIWNWQRFRLYNY